MENFFTNTRKKLSLDETQEVITPFAFKLDESLFGIAIASPWKRGVALATDLFFVAVLSSAGGEFLAIALAIMAFRLGSKQRAEQEGKVKGRKRRAIMRFIGALIVFVLLIETLPEIFDDIFNDSEPSYSNQRDEDWAKEQGIISAEGKSIDVGQALKITGYVINVINDAEQKNCALLECWLQVFAQVPEQAVNLKLTAEEADEVFAGLSDATELAKQQQLALEEQLRAKFAVLNQANILKLEQQAEADKKANLLAAVDKEIGKQQPNSNNEKQQNPSRPIYSIMQLIKGIIDDLGLGFGWAALYFSVFTARWNGQTPGKKLLGIRVLQLDGTPLSLWDSFGRYGGYGAGIATGLLGFLQIYWDPNRQAIHDKISATVVIDEKKVVDPELVLAAKVKPIGTQPNDIKD